jgi:hypothetical protein
MKSTLENVPPHLQHRDNGNFISPVFNSFLRPFFGFWNVNPHPPPTPTTHLEVICKRRGGGGRNGISGVHTQDKLRGGIPRARIFKRLWSQGIDSKELIPPAYVDCAGNLSPAMGARNQVGIGLSYRPAWLLSSRLGS